MAKNKFSTRANQKKWHQTVFNAYRENWSILSDQQIADKLEVDLIDYLAALVSDDFKKLLDKEWQSFYQKHRLDMATKALDNPVDFAARVRREDPNITMVDLYYYYCGYIMRESTYAKT